MSLLKGTTFSAMGNILLIRQKLISDEPSVTKEEGRFGKYIPKKS
jgi:hypothetical protein